MSITSHEFQKSLRKLVRKITADKACVCDLTGVRPHNWCQLLASTYGCLMSDGAQRQEYWRIGSAEVQLGCAHTPTTMTSCILPVLTGADEVLHDAEVVGHSKPMQQTPLPLMCSSFGKQCSSRHC